MISVQDIEKLAELSRIALTQEEKEGLAKEIGSILNYVGEIQKVSSNVAQKEAGVLRNVLREDVSPNESASNTAVIVNEMPNKSGSYLKVKKIL